MKRFRDEARAASVTLSGAQEDGGLFNFDFADARYLPFELRGVISTWELRLSGWDTGMPQLDWDSIADVVLHLRYTARSGGEPLASKVSAMVTTLLSEMVHADQAGASSAVQGQLFGMSARRDSPDEWHAFLFPPDTDDDQALTLPLDVERLPVAHQAASPRVQQLRVYLLAEDPGDFTGGDEDELPSTLTLSGSTVGSAQKFITDPTVGGQAVLDTGDRARSARGGVRFPNVPFSAFDDPSGGVA